MSEAIYVEVNGLKELDRAFARMGKDVQKQWRQKLKGVGKVVSDEAQVRARSHGLVRTGKLVRSIKPAVRRGDVFVRVSAKKASAKYPAGYSYPAVYEFGRGGSRAFLAPALHAKADEVAEALGDAIDRVHHDGGFR